MSKQITEGVVEERVWDHDDTYLVVEVQVDEAAFRKGDKVKITIQKISEENQNGY
jgi:hypothetical protein